MKRTLAVSLFLGLVTFAISGCDSGGTKNTMQGVEKSAIEEYEAMIEAGNQAMTEQDDSKTP